MQPENLTINLPKAVPAPKFQLFEQVYFEGTLVSIIGIKWIDATYALSENILEYGWFYAVSGIYGLTVEQIMELSFAERQETSEIYESELQPAK